jgi:hypothetical protein
LADNLDDQASDLTSHAKTIIAGYSANVDTTVDLDRSQAHWHNGRTIRFGKHVLDRLGSRLRRPLSSQVPGDTEPSGLLQPSLFGESSFGSVSMHST